MTVLLSRPRRFGPLLGAAIVLGFGLGGTLGGLVEAMIVGGYLWGPGLGKPAAMPDGASVLVWDGMAACFRWFTTFSGIHLLWRAAKMPQVPLSNRVLVGGGLLGWCLQIVVEGLLGHHMLGLHPWRKGSAEVYWDLGSILLASGLLLVGAVLVRRARGPWFGGGEGLPPPKHPLVLGVEPWRNSR